MAFDLNATPLTQGFVAPNSAEMAAALGALNQRTPLGSCDLEKALETALKSFSGDNKSARAIVYIGDGSSRANVLTADQLDRVVNDLVAQRTPVIALWSRSPDSGANAGNPGLAHGGHGRAGSRPSGCRRLWGLAWSKPLHGSVLWPKAGGAVKWPDGMDVYPKMFPPMRSDRDTVVIGTEKSTAAKQVEIDVEGPARPSEVDVATSPS